MIKKIYFRTFVSAGDLVGPGHITKQPYNAAMVRVLTAVNVCITGTINEYAHV